MAEKANAENTEATEGSDKGGKGGGLSLKLMIAILAIMAVEGVAVFFLVTMMASTPKDAVAELVTDETDPEALVEVLLTDEQYQNMTSNQVWIWEAQIFLKVRRKNLDFVERQLEQRSAEIQEGITQIFRRAKLTELREPDFRTGSRQLTALVNEVFGNDADGLPRVERLVIAKLRGFPRN